MANNMIWGWAMVLGGLVCAAALTPVFLRDDVCGGYASFRRRFLRLGHVAAVMLGVLNILAALSGSPFSASLAIGGAGMAAGCLVAACWDRAKFALPLFAAAVIWGCIEVLRSVG
jgi:hypothetical protein